MLFTSQFGSVQTYLSNSMFDHLINDDFIPFINVVILNQDMNPVNFNNIDWFLNLTFKFVYKKALNTPLSLAQYQQEYKHPEHEETTMEEEILLEEDRNYFNELSKYILYIKMNFEKKLPKDMQTFGIKGNGQNRTFGKKLQTGIRHDQPNRDQMYKSALFPDHIKLVEKTPQLQR